jgi:transcription initiation factor TFIID subunit 1
MFEKNGKAQAFLVPVNSKKVPDYYKLVRNPIDLLTIRKRINEKFYKNRHGFLDDIKLLVENSSLYNGPGHFITHSAHKLYETSRRRVDEKSEQIGRLEKAINPLLDENSLIRFHFLLDKIFEKHVMTVENSFSFLKPVNKTKYKDYYEVVKKAIDLEAIKQVSIELFSFFFF